MTLPCSRRIRRGGALLGLTLLSQCFCLADNAEDGPSPIWKPSPEEARTTFAQASDVSIDGEAFAFFLNQEAEESPKDAIHRFLVALVLAKEANATFQPMGHATDEETLSELEAAWGGPRSLEAKLYRDLGVSLSGYKSILEQQRLVKHWYAEAGERIPCPAAEVEAYYYENRDAFDSVEAQHIAILRVDRSGKQPLSDPELSKRRQRARELFEAAQDGADFDELVQKWSEDLSSREAKGRFLFKRNTMLPSFDAWCFRAKADAIGLVETKEAFHIVRLNRRSGFADAQAEAEAAYRHDRLREQIDALRQTKAYALLLSSKAKSLLNKPASRHSM